ncbi:MAG: ChaN family lipoprotein [Gemmatimonadaceae bacterium]
MLRITHRFYEAQRVKDEAMGEALVAAWRRAGHGAIVVHYNGAFHSDFGLGTAERARRRASAARTLIISAVPLASLDTIPLDPHRARADFVLFTKRLAASATRQVP